MADITMSESEIEKLSAIEEPTAIRNSSGEIIGVFTPARPLDDLDRQALERLRKWREHPGKTYTTQEVLEHLKRLESTECHG